MKLIWCSSPFHIFTAINMKVKMYFDDPVSIILTDYSVDSMHFYNILCKDKRFENVYYIPSKKILKRFDKGSFWYRFFYFLFSEVYLSKHKIDLRQVDELIFPYRDQIVKAIAKCVRKEGVQIKCSYYDDGGGSYCGGVIAPDPSRLELAMGVPIRLFIPDNIYLYTPRLCDNYDCLSIKQLPSIDNAYIYDLYREKGTTECYGKGILLDQNVYDVSDLLLEWASKITVKKHPKRMDDIYEKRGFPHFWIDTQPFELAIMGDSQLDNRVFITVYSTAAMTPKMLFDREPTVVFLKEFVYIEDKRESQDVEQLLYRFRDTYRDKSRVYIPNTATELRAILCKVL